MASDLRSLGNETKQGSELGARVRTLLDFVMCASLQNQKVWYSQAEVVDDLVGGLQWVCLPPK